MNAKLNIGSRSPLLTVAAATVAGFATLTILWATVTLFQSRGVPFGDAVAASRACAHHVSQADRDACVRQWLAESQATWRTRAAK
jgi:hypothetical protein